MGARGGIRAPTNTVLAIPGPLPTVQRPSGVEVENEYLVAWPVHKPQAFNEAA